VKIRQYFPDRKILNRIIVKSILGVFISSAMFTVFNLVLVTILFFISREDRSLSSLSSGLWAATIITISWSLLFATVPAILGGVILTFFIYRDFRKGKSSKHKAIVIGIQFVGLVGLFISLCVAFTVFRPSDSISALPYAIPVTLIAGLVGAWGGLQIYKEIFNFQEKTL
jgi:hypothetical protein